MLTEVGLGAWQPDGLIDCVEQGVRPILYDPGNKLILNTWSVV
jgi:hypothetical protein